MCIIYCHMMRFDVWKGTVLSVVLTRRTLPPSPDLRLVPYIIGSFAAYSAVLAVGALCTLLQLGLGGWPF